MGAKRFEMDWSSEEHGDNSPENSNNETTIISLTPDLSQDGKDSAVSMYVNADKRHKPNILYLIGKNVRGKSEWLLMSGIATVIVVVSFLVHFTNFTRK